MYAASLAPSPAPGPRHGRTLVAAFVGAVTLLGLSAEATRAAEAPASKRVSFADLNLRSPAGRETLERRVRSAARQVCDMGPYSSVAPFRREKECIRLTIGHAMAQVDQVVLLAELSR